MEFNNFVLYSTERKLQPNEIPHQLYVQNYSTASSTCLCVRRWLFSIDRETTLPHGEQAAMFIFYQVNLSIFQNKQQIYYSIDSRPWKKLIGIIFEPMDGYTN